jgi:tetratricopeptide (TPR) repeat protein
MGREQTRTGKHLYFCIASLIFVSLWGCAALEEMMAQGEAQDSLLRGRTLLAKGDFEGALKENQKVLSSFGVRSPGDEALFHTGLIHAHNDNPNKDYRKALGFFRRLIKDYPQSRLIAQAKIWVGVLEEDERLSQALERLKEENEGLSQAFKKLKDEHGKLTQQFKRLKEVDIEIEDKKREKGR